MQSVIPESILRPLVGKNNEAESIIACRVLGRVWIEGPEGALLGAGRVELLEQIRKHGSISSAARAMDMSYRHAWELIESMNRQSGSPLVLTETGGRGGGGARLTAVCERAISAYQELQQAFEEFMVQRTQALRLYGDAETETVDD